MNLLELAEQYRWLATLVLWVSAGWKMIRFFTRGGGADGTFSAIVKWVAALVLATWLLVGNGLEQMTRMVDWAVDTLPDLLERINISTGDGCDRADGVDCPPADDTDS